MDNQRVRPANKQRDTALVVLGIVIAVAMAVAMLYALRGATAADVLGRLTVAVLLASAATMLGGLLGFLFGIPRTLQPEGIDEAADTEKRTTYRPNTSLEQISDWLTKILVGVGLTQIGGLPEHFGALGANLAPAFGGDTIDEAFVITLAVMLLIAGFLFGFLWTRLYLPGAFRAADLGYVVDQVTQAVRAQADLDAEALNLADQVLGAPPGQQAPNQDLLNKAIGVASANARLLIFERARENRQQNWREVARKRHMERSTPLFHALIASGEEAPIRHRYYGNLGFALKDQAEPNWAAAEKELTEAINLRGPWEDFGYTYYELNRAICRIMRDPARADGGETAEPLRTEILKDLRAAHQSGLADIVMQEESIPPWLERNKIRPSNLAT